MEAPQMREIKFRAWHKESKEMLTVETIRWEPENKWVTFKEDFCVAGAIINDTQEHEIHSGCPLEEVELLQYTGLKDKNSKEIYEGDVVRFPDPYYETVDVGIGDMPVAEHYLYSFFPVTFEKGQFGMRMGKTNNFHEAWYSFLELEDEIGFDELEIIGNIYETPELLEK